MQELTWSSTNKKIYSSRWLLREAQKNCNTYDLKNYHTPNKKRRWARLRGTKNSYGVIAVLNLAKHLTTTYYQPWISMLLLWLHWYDSNKIWCKHLLSLKVSFVFWLRVQTSGWTRTADASPATASAARRGAHAFGGFLNLGKVNAIHRMECTNRQISSNCEQ